MVMLRFWLNMEGNRATGNALERALRKCDREDIVNKCIFNVELVTDEMEQSAAKAALASDLVCTIFLKFSRPITLLKKAFKESEFDIKAA